MGVPSISGEVSAVCGEPMSSGDLYMYSIDLRISVVGADWYRCRVCLRRLRRKKAREMRAIRKTAPAMAPPISAPRWFFDDDDGGDDEAEAGVGEAVCMIMFVVVMRPPLAEVTTETILTILTSRVGEGFAGALPPAFLVVEVDVDAEVDVVVGVVEVEDDDDVLSSLDVVSPLPSGFPTMLAEATAGPAVLMEATELPLGSGKKSLESVLSQQTLDAFRL